MNEPGQIEQQPLANGLCLRAPGHSRSLNGIRRQVGEQARRSGFSEAAVAQIEMSVDEACSNVIQHAYSPATKWCWQHRDPELRLNVQIAHNQLVIEINDHGQSFDFTAARPASIDDRLQQMHTGGYGIFIICRLMDEVVYTSSATTGNTLRLVKYLPQPLPAAIAAVAV